MNTPERTTPTFLPKHWIGIPADWYEFSAEPWQHLVSLPPSEMKTHTLLIGATGSGKTNLLHHLVSQDIENGHSLCVLDLRGDLVAAVLELCAGNVDPKLVKVLDLREKTKPLGFNPLFGNGEPYFRALNVLDVVASESDSWGVQLAETLRNCLMLLAEAKEPLTRLESLFYDPHFRAQCLNLCQSEPVLSFWTRFGDLSSDRQLGYASPVLNKVSLLTATPGLRRMLGHPQPLNLRAHLDRPGSILLVSLAADELHAAGRMVGRMVLSSICREIFARVDIPESKRNPVRLYVDEFEHFGLEEFESIFAEGRRFGLSVVIAHQTLAQLSTRMRSMVLNNVGIKFAFRCGREDSGVLSRDFTGDAKAIDIAELPVGHAAIWRRGQGYDILEINEPLLSDVGLTSSEAEAFIAEIYADVPPHQDAESSVRPPKDRKPFSGDAGASEEWL